MNFKDTGFEKKKVELTILQEILEKYGFYCASGWDYERMTFDYKFEVAEETYYLRIPTKVIHGDISTTLEILTPYIGKHYYPHGLEYGEDELFPQNIIGRCEKILKNLMKDLLKSPNPLL